MSTEQVLRVAGLGGSVIVLTCATMLIARFFAPRWQAPVFRAFAVYFIVVGPIFFALVAPDYVLDLPRFVRHRLAVLRGLHAAAILYLTVALLRPSVRAARARP